MARPPAPPGPPPPHFRPRGTPPGVPPVPAGPLAGQPPAPIVPSGIGPGAATAIATVMLLVGLVAGFFVGRAYDDDGGDVGPATAGTIAPSPPTTQRPTGDTIPQQAPSAPPSTDLPPESIGTLESPVPVGQAYVLGLFEIEVLRVDRDAGDALTDHDRSNPAAPAGQQHVLVELAVRFTDATGLGDPSSIPFFVSDGTTEWSASESSCGALPEPLAGADPLEQGDEAVGTVCFTVPTDAVAGLVLGTESFAGPVWFALP